MPPHFKAFRFFVQLHTQFHLLSWLLCSLLYSVVVRELDRRASGFTPPNLVINAKIISGKYGIRKYQFSAAIFFLHRS